MPAINLAKGYWDLASERTNKVRLHNMVVLENKASPTGETYKGRPATQVYDTRGSGPIRKIFRQDGVLNGLFLTVSGSDFYYSSTLIGEVGSEGVQMAGSDDRVVIVASGAAWRFSIDGTFASIVMPDDVPGQEGAPARVSSVRYINGFFLLSVENSQRFYWIQPGQDDPDPLDFASAERLPDNIVSIALSGDEIWMLGQEGEEVFAVTTDTDAPFQSIIGRVYSAGCADIDSVQELGTVLAWVSRSRTVVVARGEPVPISDDSIAEILADQPTFKAWNFRMSGHAWYVVTTPAITLAFDFASQRWSRFSSFGYDTWRPVAGAQDGAFIVCGDSESGRMWSLSFDANRDAGDPLIREVSGTVDIVGKPIGCASVSIGTAVGFGDGPLELKWSDTQGKSWSAWRQVPLGEPGQYATDATVRSLGTMMRPGRTFVWRWSADSPFRVDYATYNEA